MKMKCALRAMRRFDSEAVMYEYDGINTKLLTSFCGT